MDRRIKAILLVLGGLVAVAAILLFLFWPSLSPKTNENANVNTPPTMLPGTNIVVPPASNGPRPLSEEEKAATAPKTIAISFAERVDSYSSQSGLTNLEDVRPLVTDGVYAFLDKTYRSRLAADFPSDGSYLGVSAHVVSARQVTYDGTRAGFELSMQEVWSGTKTGTEYKTMSVVLVRDGDGWLVDDFKWK